MSGRFCCFKLLSATALVALFVGEALAVNLEFVTVSNPGNPGELSGIPNSRVCGAVTYVYRIGRFEVTAGQYCEFLNAVAATDTYGLYNTSMGSTGGCMIQRSGSDGSYTYSVASDWANRPVNYVSWRDALRFANWLTNGQPTGAQDATTTQDGSYDLNATDSMIERRPNARYVIPGEDEWYKAAYHKNDGVTGNYWTYPTRTDSRPSNVLSSTGTNNANYFNDGDTIGPPYYRTNVGEFASSPSPYGTFDQGGNVAEWLDTPGPYPTRGLRGGSFGSEFFYLQADTRAGREATYEGPSIGFRVAEVPEPVSLTVSGFGLALLAARRRSL